ncbi:hypothetical protein, partial [Pedobacter steynii]
KTLNSSFSDLLNYMLKIGKTYYCSTTFGIDPKKDRVKGTLHPEYTGQNHRNPVKQESSRFL